MIKLIGDSIIHISYITKFVPKELKKLIVIKMKLILCLISTILSSIAIKLNCNYSFEWWPVSGKKYSCVTTLSEVSTNQRLTEISGDHQNSKNHSDVESIEFIDCTGSTFIPRNIMFFFPNLIGVRLVNCGILILSGSELNEYGNLSLFAVEGTQLERIPGNFFSATPLISIIGFADNKLKYVGSTLLNNLPNLSWISFYNNECINQTATKPEEISMLIGNLTSQCVDTFEILTTTTVKTTTEMSSTVSTTEMQTTTLKAGIIELNIAIKILLMAFILFRFT